MDTISNDEQYDLKTFHDYITGGQPREAFTVGTIELTDDQSVFVCTSGDVLFQNITIYNLEMVPVHFESSITQRGNTLNPGRRGALFGKKDGVVICIKHFDNNGYRCGLEYKDRSNIYGYKQEPRKYTTYHIPHESLVELTTVYVPELGLSFSYDRDSCHSTPISMIDEFYKNQLVNQLHQHSSNGAYDLRVLWPKKQSHPSKLYTCINKTIITIPIILDYNISVPTLSCKFINDAQIRKTYMEEISTTKLSAGTSVFIDTTDIFLTSDRAVMLKKLTAEQDELDSLRSTNDYLEARLKSREQELNITKERLGIYEADMARTENVNKTNYKNIEANAKIEDAKNKSRDDLYGLISNIVKVVAGVIGAVATILKITGWFVKPATA